MFPSDKSNTGPQPGNEVMSVSLPPVNGGGPTWPLAISLGLVSAAALVVEILAGRMLAPYVGMSLHTWTSIIGCVLAGLSAGHWLGGRIDPGDRRRTHQRVAWVLVFAALSVAATPWLVQAVAPGILALANAPVVAISLLALALFFVPSALAGILSPLLTRLALDADPNARSRVLGRMYAAGAIGGIAGTLAAGYLLLSWLGSRGTAATVSVVYIALAFAFAMSASRRTPRATGGAVAAGVVLLASVSLVPLMTASACDVESDYYCVRVVDYSDDAGRPSALLVIDHMGHGINDRDEPRWMHTTYAALTDRLLRIRGVSDREFRAYFIGGGAYTLPRAWRRSFPGADLVVAEIDPAVTRVARDRLWFDSADSIEIRHADARRWLSIEGRERNFDVIVGDAFHDLSIPAHLTTVEFNALVHERLDGPGSFYALTVIDSPAKPAMLASMARTLAGVFPVVEIWVDETQWQTGGRSTFLLLAADEATPARAIAGRSPDDAAGARRWIQLGDRWLADATASLRTVMLTDDLAPVDRLMYPLFAHEFTR